MLRREQGWAFDGSRPDIWEAVDGGGAGPLSVPHKHSCHYAHSPTFRFINRVAETRQTDEPPAFYGGVIADPMGLGKTLTMIALIASDAQTLASGDPSSVTGVLGEESCDLTLVIVPPACESPCAPMTQRLGKRISNTATFVVVLGTWEDELKT